MENKTNNTAAKNEITDNFNNRNLSLVVASEGFKNKCQRKVNFARSKYPQPFFHKNRNKHPCANPSIAKI